MIRIGLLSDARLDASFVVSALGREFEILPADSEAATSETIASEKFDVLVAELTSEGESEEELIEGALRLIDTQVPLIVLARDGMRDAAQELVEQGAFGYCMYPPSIKELKALLLRAYETSQLKESATETQGKAAPAAECDRLIGSSPQIRHVHHLIDRVANLNATVLVTGESGTGKELIARAIHHKGSRTNRPFVAVSCGAIPETLIEAELFGHEKGAFTGTVGSREGYFEQARDGTLFLDEIGDLSLYTQVKLLRVLQQMEFSRLGSSKLIPLRARLIFATHQDLGRLVAEGKFRQDLYYRINVMKIVSPSLAEHAEDLPLIATHYLRYYARMFQKPMEAIAPDAMTMLMNYAWPGNVRELENTIQRAIILAPGTVIRAEDLPLNLHTDKVIEFGEYSPDCSFERQLRDYKVKLAMDAVRESKGNKTIAARNLGISRAYLHRLLRLADGDGSCEAVTIRSASFSA